MATTILPTHTFSVRASAASDNTRRKTSTGTTSGGKWWAPIFGWSTNADYIDSSSSSKEESKALRSESVSEKSKFSRGCFTEEKAKQLRMMTKDTASFHDAMYHSAIASRLASDFSLRDSDHH
ncbi:SH3 domain and tetratricopeptide repeat-containing protein 1 [Bienertia sinuspersici]